MDLQLRLSLIALKCIVHTTRFIKGVLCCCRNGDQVPPVTNGLLMFSATVLAEKIRKKEVTCYEVITAYIDRIKEVNPIINAIADERFDAALREAKEVDEFLNTNKTTSDELKLTKPLLGIPVTIKENLALKGLNQTLGTQVRLGKKAPENGAAVQRLKDAGAILLLVSTTPEYCVTIETYSKVYGITRNPYNSKRVAGGSSGGEGALLGAGASLIGLGSDLAGSIRFPSAFNGVFGHKPTHGIIPLEGHLPWHDNVNFQTYLTLGPMCRYSEDMVLAMEVLGNEHEMKALKLDEKVDLSSLKIFSMEDCGRNFGLLEVQSEIRQAINNSVRHLKTKCFSEVSNKKFELLGLSTEIITVISTTMDLGGCLKDGEVEHGAFGQLMLSMFGKSKFCASTILHELIGHVTEKQTNARKIQEHEHKLITLKEEMMKELGDNGVFLYPVFPTTAFRHKEFLISYPGLSYSFIINMLGFPSTTVPIDIDIDGLPVGIQVIASINQDRLCLAVAQELEKAFGGWLPT